MLYGKDSRELWLIGKDGDDWKGNFFGMSVENEALRMVSAGPRVVVPWVTGTLGFAAFFFARGVG